MNKILCLLSCCLCFTSLSCAHRVVPVVPIVVVKEKIILAPASCRDVCKIRKKTCDSECKNVCGDCRKKLNRSTFLSYQKYVHEECVKGGFIARDMNSYRDLLQCRKVATNCLADYDVCIQACSGVIRKQLRVPPPCC